MTHASLFSGIGGFDLAAEWMGWNNASHCKINEFCTKILNYHFQDAEHYTDITRTDFSKWRKESVKAYGNAIVPQVAYEIFKAIELCR